ncbi:hypothetical protein A2415_04645 [candidate division WWE3 bacterium RIFOXYC1_FULL_39_7]|uniref:Excinuclease ABC subunit C n=2 Tax=Katanobacteria TaxID=422282 RepID=A0A1F4X767_UNCKA|nr:MAG: hypothetical protein A2415_04645 [candidate division WWE3 bacterium RIFOXYC1_FULL_39_7]OGC77507.1 MAG: hypothetical protein A2619_01370 [candidate division WWE3 bacterium RIFOXYD1_FULL_39_9]
MKDQVIKTVQNLPSAPGVYLFKNSSGVVIYVGKAKRLRDRVGSYFHADLDPNSKTFALVQRIEDIEYVEVQSELEAFVLEAALIKKHRPKYNIIQKDDKSYIYIAIRKEKAKIGDSTVLLPKVLTIRETDAQKNDLLFGPYPNGTTAKYIVRALRKIFPFRDCDPAKFNRYHKLGRPCLFGDLGLCPAPCINYSEKDLLGYKKNIETIKKVLNGGSTRVVKNMEIEMNAYSKKQDYENAARIRDIIAKYKYVSQKFRRSEEYINNPYLINDIADRAINDLAVILPVLDGVPNRIECYDISNISGKEAVGSMVVAVNGRINKKEYRKFKIKLSATPDDFQMMKEVLTRRLKNTFERSDDKVWPKPDLIVVDGGKGQVGAALEVMSQLNVSVPLVGLAKKEEILVFKDEFGYVELKYPKDSAGLNLIIRLRDEAHRFAQSYHHKLRLQKIRIEQKIV